MPVSLIYLDDMGIRIQKMDYGRIWGITCFSRIVEWLWPSLGQIVAVITYTL